MNLSPHVTLEEFVATQHRSIDNTLPDELLDTARETAAMLENVREFLCHVAGRDVPIYISSGYRCPDLNRAVGSAPTSDHLKAMAADWTAPSFGSPYLIATALAPHITELGVGQLIYEWNSWVHTSTRTPDKVVNRVITIDSNGTKVGV